MLPEAVLEVIDPLLGRFGRRRIRLDKSPFLIGRAPDNDLLLLDHRISRRCGAIVFADGCFRFEDRGNKHGVFINDQRIDSHSLGDGDTISFGVADSYQLVFRLSAVSFSQDEQVPVLASPDHRLGQVSLLLEATAFVHSQLPIQEVLAALVDRAVEVSGAARGALLQIQDEGKLQPVLARQNGARPLAIGDVRFTWEMESEVKAAIETRQSIFSASTAPEAAIEAGYPTTELGHGLYSACVPLFTQSEMRDGGPGIESEQEQLLGVVYLDSPHDLRFPGQRILDALAVQAASVLGNLRLLQREQERQRMNQELAIAREIQQGLLPKSFKERSHLQVAGINRSCLSVGGDYFDLIELGPARTAFIIADVSGKGLGAALVSSLLQGTFSGLALGHEPAIMFNHANQFVIDRTEGARFATLFFGILDASGRLQYLQRCQQEKTVGGILHQKRHIRQEDRS